MPSCQFSLYPLGTGDLSPVIDRALDQLKEMGIVYEMGNMSTVFYGSSEEIFTALKRMYEAVSMHPVVMNFTVSNACPVSPKGKEKS